MDLRVPVERDASTCTSFDDSYYGLTGAEIVDDAPKLYVLVDPILKVKESPHDEVQHFRADQTVFAYFYFAAALKLTETLLERQVTAAAYETLPPTNCELLLLKPMSEVSGKMSVPCSAARTRSRNIW